MGIAGRAEGDTGESGAADHGVPKQPATGSRPGEKTLAQDEFLLRTLMDHIPDHIYFKDRDSRFIRINRALAQVFGLSDPAQAVGKTDFDFFTEEHARQAHADEQAVMRMARPVTKVERETWADRPDTWVSTTKVPLRDEAGNIVGTCGISRDVTERKRAEEALASSEAKFRSLVEGAVHGIFRSTPEGRLVSANPALVEMLGYPSEDLLLAHDLVRRIYVHREEGEQLIAQYRDAQRIDGVDALWQRQDGTPIMVRLSGRPVRRPDGSVEGFDMLVEDVTERHRLEEQLRQAQKIEAIGQLAGGVAHDFNNLLTAITASCDLLSSELPPDSTYADDLKTIRTAAERGAELTKRLLAFSRRQPLMLRNVSLAAVADGFLPIARRAVSEDIELAVRVDAGDTTVNADANAVEQILMNLVTNARDATPAGGQIVIEVGRRVLDEVHRQTYGWGEPGEYVTLTVGDTGHGMDAATQQRIFEPFFTTKPVDQGTGLGMAVVYGLVKQHDGFVQVYSEVGQGTTVRIYLPAVAGLGEHLAPAAPPVVRGGSETILLVEDDVSVRHAATRVLERFGYTVLTAADGQEALDLLPRRASPPDLIVCDVVMPHVSGPHLLSKLREAGPVPRLLFTSGYTARDVVGRAQLEPGLPFLAKPWTVTDLLRKVREVLDSPAAG
jgi:PAS domain S-box-containing protein